MKKIKLVAILTVLLGITGCDIVSSPSTYDLVQPTEEYEIDTWGSNSEVYEFQSKVNPNYTCMMLMLDNGKAVGLQCFPKK